MPPEPEPLVTSFSIRARHIAERDGLPAAGSDAVWLHKPIANDRYIHTYDVMASFCLPNKKPIALLEQLWVDGEHTHITDRTAIVVDPLTGKIQDANLLFQKSRGDYTSVMACMEIYIDHARKSINNEKRNKAAGFQQRIAGLSAKRDFYAAAIPAFEKAAARLDVTLSPALLSTRQLYRIHPSCRIARYNPPASAMAA
jgi:hypothetical protein